MGNRSSSSPSFEDAQPFQNVRDAIARRKSPEWAQTDYWGRSSEPGGERAFGLASGLESKFIVKDGQISWKGFSGIIQFISKFPFGYLTRSSWATTLNQMFWNVVIFILIFGSFYGLMIRYKHIRVPDATIAQQNLEDGGATDNNNYMLQGMYYATVTTTTLGLGDIYPKTVGGQIMVMFHILLFFMFNFIWLVDYGIPMLS